MSFPLRLYAAASCRLILISHFRHTLMPQRRRYASCFSRSAGHARRCCILSPSLISPCCHYVTMSPYALIFADDDFAADADYDVITCLRLFTATLICLKTCALCRARCRYDAYKMRLCYIIHFIMPYATSARRDAMPPAIFRCRCRHAAAAATC